MSEWRTLSVGDGEGSPIARGKLEDMDVRRVDAVGSPATGHRWAIIKSSPDPQRQEALEHELAKRRSRQVEHGILTAEQRRERSKSLSTRVEHALMRTTDARGDDSHDGNAGVLVTDRFGVTKHYGGPKN